MNTIRQRDALIDRLHQAAVWVTIGDEDQPTVHRLDHMALQHQRNTLAWLRDRAVELHRRQHEQYVGAVRRGAHPMEVMQIVAEHGRLDPHVWLEETPLVRRLVQLAGREPLPPRGLLRRWRLR